jgi:hypothetical protein
MTGIIRTIQVRSPGWDGIPQSPDDFNLATFSRLEKPEDESNQPTAEVERAHREGGGAIAGIVREPTRARLPQTSVTAVCPDRPEFRYESASDDSGNYLISNLPPCQYVLRVEKFLFVDNEMTDISVRSGETTVVDVTLEIGQIIDTIEVPAAAAWRQTEPVQAYVKGSPGVTPRLSEYSLETLLWAPDIETGTDGRTRIRFTPANSIMTWKLVALGSTVEGEVGVGSAEVRAFRPFSVDHDPPPALAEGDEISLPATIRNYLEDEQ